jgi:hypothetical protein
MTDQQILSKLRSMEHWVTVEPWKSMADRFEELMQLEKSKIVVDFLVKNRIKYPQ